MVFGWFRPRRSAPALSVEDEHASVPLLHDRVRAALGNPGTYLCRPVPGAEALWRQGTPTPLIRWQWRDGNADQLSLLRGAATSESWLLLERTRSGEPSWWACGLLPAAVVDDAWRLANTLQKLFAANLRLDPPLLDSAPNHVFDSPLLPARHLEALFLAALQQLPAADRLADAAFAAWWRQASQHGEAGA